MAIAPSRDGNSSVADGIRTMKCTSYIGEFCENSHEVCQHRSGQFMHRECLHEAIRGALVGISIAFAVLHLMPSTLHGQIEPAADAPQPLSPDESHKHFRLRDGLRIELVASEPLVADPAPFSSIIADKCLSASCTVYNLEGHLDIVELNRSGKLDRQVRRVRVEGELLERAKKGRTGTVKRLIDRDGDGRMDECEVWADDLPPCYGMVEFRDGLIVVCGPDIVFLADRDEDGRAEVRQLLFTGFDVEVMERAINNPRWGLDGWIYVAAGGGNPTVEGPALPEKAHLGRTDFRFLPDGSRIEAVTGTNGTFGHAFNDYGDRFLMTTSTPSLYAIPIPRRLPDPQSLHCLASGNRQSSKLQSDLPRQQAAPMEGGTGSRPGLGQVLRQRRSNAQRLLYLRLCPTGLSSGRPGTNV